MLFAILCGVLCPASSSLAAPPPTKPAAKPVIAPRPVQKAENAPAGKSPAASNEGPTGIAGELSVAELTAKVRDSTVVISVLDPRGQRSSLGSGFVVAKDGLIATNLHVIAEARPIVVALADGRKFDVTEIRATDKAMDLAIIRIDANDLKPLMLGDSDTLKQGQEVVAIGNPRGLEYSVVSGIVSAIRTIDNKAMFQLAMPIEEGNSGGPLLDRDGRVHGIITMKSAVTENLGFAVAVNALKPLLQKPNPIPIRRWLTIGALDAQNWTQHFGGRWRQRAGRILVEGPGEGFGGRTLLVSKRQAPQEPIEIAVWVRLENESGAAGLTFNFHAPDQHYGFYPSNGRIRLTRFDGPDIYNWHVLSEVRSPAYRRGEWNRFKVRLEKGKIFGYVNDVLVVEEAEDTLHDGQAGLASFRNTHAEFKGFEIGKNLPSVLPSSEVLKRVENISAAMNPDSPPDAKSVEPLLPDADAGILALRQRADLREREAKQLRRLAQTLQHRRILKELSALFDLKDDKRIDLVRAALLVARQDNNDLDVEAYLREVDRMAAAIRSSVPPKASVDDTLKVLDEHFFQKLGFHGSRSDFSNRSNSYLNEVIDDREGLPITLSVLYIELARRLDVNVMGVGLPKRFLVRYESTKKTETYIDVYEGGRRMSREQADAQTTAFADRSPSPDEWKAQTKSQIVQRIVQNLLAHANETFDTEAALRYVEVLLLLNPDSLAEHWQRALLCFQTGRRIESLAETNWLLAKDPEKLSKIATPSELQQLKELLESEP